MIEAEAGRHRPGSRPRPPARLPGGPRPPARLPGLAVLGTALLGLALLAAGCTAGSSPGTGQPGPGRPPGTSSPGTGSPGKSPTFQATLAPWHLPAPVSRPVVLGQGADLVVLGGLTSSDTSSSAVLRVDPATGTTTRVASLAEATHDAGGAVLRGRYLVFGGGSTAVHSAVQAYVPGQASAPIIGQLPQPRADLSVTAIGATAYLAGGYDGTTLDPSVLSTTDGTTFATVAKLPEPVRYGALAALGQYLWVVGGMPGSGSTADVQRVDTRTGTVKVMGSLPVPLDHAAAAVVDGQVLIFGGLVGGQPSAAIWRLDPSTGSASRAGTLPVAVSMPGVATVGGVAYVVGGEGPSTLDTVMEVRPSRSP